MNFSLDVSVPALTVFFQGLLSFFSPCVLPLIPLYIGYLSGGTGKRGADGKIHYQKSKVMIHTLCFVIGVSFAFFALGFGVSALGSFLPESVVLLLYYLGSISLAYLETAVCLEKSADFRFIWTSWRCLRSLH